MDLLRNAGSAFAVAAALCLGWSVPAQTPAPAVKLTGAPCPAADGLPEDVSYPIRKAGFDALAAGNQAEARRLMRCAIRANDKDLLALRQEVYLDLNAGDEQAASEDIDALRNANGTTAQFEAQQGYILAKAGLLDNARTAFQRAANTGDAAMREQMRKAILVLDGEYPRHEFAFAVDGQYLQRFDDGIVDASARYFERLGATSPLRAYLGVRLLRDTASNAGPLPQIFSDNALLTGVGLAFQPHKAHYSLNAEANGAYVFYGGKENTAVLVPDYRAVAGYYRVWRPGEGRTFLEANGSLGFYSRYGRDFIAYLQPRQSFDLLREYKVRIAPFFQESLALDSNREFFNNTLELIPGVELGLHGNTGASLRAEYVRGVYLPSSGTSANPYGSSYNDLRIRLTFSRGLLLHTGAQ